MRLVIPIMVIVLFGCSQIRDDAQFEWVLAESSEYRSVTMYDVYPDSIVTKQVEFYPLKIINQLADSLIVPIDRYDFINAEIVESDCENDSCNTFAISDNYYGNECILRGKSAIFELRAVDKDTACSNCEIKWRLGLNSFKDGRRTNISLEIVK